MALFGILKQLLACTKLASPAPEDLLGFSTVAHKTRKPPQKAGLWEWDQCEHVYLQNACRGSAPSTATSFRNSCSRQECFLSHLSHITIMHTYRISMVLCYGPSSVGITQPKSLPIFSPCFSIHMSAGRQISKSAPCLETLDCEGFSLPKLGSWWICCSVQQHSC